MTYIGLNRIIPGKEMIKQTLKIRIWLINRIVARYGFSVNCFTWWSLRPNIYSIRLYSVIRVFNSITRGSCLHLSYPKAIVLEIINDSSGDILLSDGIYSLRVVWMIFLLKLSSFLPEEVHNPVHSMLFLPNYYEE